MKKWFVLLLLSFPAAYGLACTTFLLEHNGHFYFGRNYDWVTESGMVMTNNRGIFKTASTCSDGAPLSWQSRFGSVTFNQYGKEFPTGGMNEQGLVVELMWLSETQYPARDQRPTVQDLQWVQYQLDCSRNVEEVIASDKLVRISATSVPIHFLVADASGHAAVIEFLDGKMTVHKKEGLPFAVLTNSTYEESMEEKSNRAIRNASDNPLGSVQRFSTVCTLLEQFRNGSVAQPVDYSFSVLNRVAQGASTKWSIVYDISSRTVHFRTQSNHSRRSFSFSEFSFDCDRPALFFDISQKAEGPVAQLFAPLTPQENRRLLERSAKESRTEVRISAGSIDRAAEQFKEVPCKK